jgi:hypothetical protein
VLQVVLLNMHASLLVLSAYCGLSAAAGPFPWMYGVPDYPDLDMAEMMTQADIESMVAGAAGDSSTGSTTVSSTNSTIPSTTAGQEPCAMVSSAIAAVPSGSRKVIPAELGVRCLQSVPLDREGNAKLIDDIKLFVKWQSNVAYLKKPPQGYTEQAVDIMGKLDSMRSGLSSDAFKTEYDFQVQMMNLFNSAYDNHFAWQPDILASAMQFQRPPGTELVSVSSDGMAMPEIYTYQDIVKANTITSFKPSPVQMIDGISAQNYLSDSSTQSDFHDVDTRWNALFPSQALIASGVTFLGSFRTGMYAGPNTTMTFANSTAFSMPNIAVVFGDFKGVDSGSTFFKKFCTGPQPVVQTQATPNGNSTQATPTAAPTPSHVGYPKAVMINPNLAVGGYYITGTGYEVCNP